ncbi:MAG TPA: hypothetical protein PLR86_10280, partial [Planctomycetota bacterium]|nr:hypothetical protein [Planctomycetota bacterium]
VVSDGLSGKKLIINPGKTEHNVQRNLILQVNRPARSKNISTDTWYDNPDNSNYRVFRVGSFYDQYSDWDIEFHYSTLRGGELECRIPFQGVDLDDHGGAISVRGKNAMLELNHSAVLGSIATGQGGGIYMDLRNSANLVIQNSSIIEGNKALEGGGIYIFGENESNVFISQSSLMKQEAIYGGVIYSISNQKAYVHIQDNTLLYENTAVDGGVIYSTSPVSSEVFLQDIVLFKNKATGYGGAIYGTGWTDEDTGIIYGTNTITLNNVIITDNTAQYGGAIATYDLDTANLIVQNSTISGNIVTEEGGGIYFNNQNSIVNLLNSIVFANYKNTVSNDVFIHGTEFEQWNVVHSIFGYSNLEFSQKSYEAIQLIVKESTVKRIFTNVTLKNGVYVPVFTVDPNLLYKGTLDIQKHGEAAYKGTLIGTLEIQGVTHYFYYKQNMSIASKGTWVSLTTDQTFDFDVTETTHYGLTHDGVDGNVTLISQNDVARDKNVLYLFNVGAASFVRNWAAGSIHVTTDSDEINLEDTNYSLREALIYAAIGVLSTQATYVDTSTITFAEGIQTITMSDAYDEFVVTDGIAGIAAQTGEPFKITAGEGRTVTVKVARTYAEDPQNASTYRVLRIGNYLNTQHDWNVTLENLTLEGGKVTETDQGGH